jgi:activating signal cointegrator 1
MHPIYTYGYSGTSPAALKAYADKLGAMVIDIRYAPWSRDPRWQKQALEAMFGIHRYRWCQDLGNVNYKNGGRIELSNPARMVPRVRFWLREQPIILLCGCRDVETCHRKDAAEYLRRETQAPIIHLDPQAAPTPGIKVITLTEPWATLASYKEKEWETRSWATQYRGPIAIHAAKTFPRWAKDLCDREPFRSVLTKHLGNQYMAVVLSRLGHILSTATLSDCVPTASIRDSISEQERAFGDYDDGRYAFRVDDVKRLQQPVFVRGALNLWTYEGELV